MSAKACEPKVRADLNDMTVKETLAEMEYAPSRRRADRHHLPVKVFYTPNYATVDYFHFGARMKKNQVRAGKADTGSRNWHSRIHPL